MKTPWEIELIKPEQKWEITLSDKVSYVLPIASPEQLGGVKPYSKTQDMDVPVAVDEEGKLWTKDKIDETLSIKGFSADAAAVGEALKNIKVDGFVSYTEQTLTDEQKTQARENIGAGENFVVPINPYKYEEQVHPTNGKTYAFYYVNAEEMQEGVLYGAIPNPNIYKVYFYFNIICDDNTEKRLAAIVDASQKETFSVMYSGNDTVGKTIHIFYHNGNSQAYASLKDKSTAANIVVNHQGNIKYISTSNSSEYIPTGDYNPATKKYVDDSVSEVSALVGDIAVFEQITTAITNSVADWNQNDENAADYIKNKPDIATDDEIIDMLTENDMLPVVADSDGAILADESDNILLW